MCPKPKNDDEEDPPFEFAALVVAHLHPFGEVLRLSVALFRRYQSRSKDGGLGETARCRAVSEFVRGDEPQM